MDKKWTAQHKFFIDYDAKRIKSISVTGFAKKIQNWPSLKKYPPKKNLAEINIEVFQAEIPSSTNGQMENQYTEEWSTEAVANFRL